MPSPAPAAPSSPNFPAAPSRGWMFAVFALVLAAHVWAVGLGLKHHNFAGNEFRQVQTAMSALFIQRDHDFSLAYPTPILGKPWSIPLEFPLYQWTVALVSDATGLPLTQSGRLVSIACFYLMLPAVWLLLRRLAVPPGTRWLMLALVLACPLHVFYARSFLIETMALMFAAWSLAGLLEFLERGAWRWGAVAAVAGAAAGAVKVTTFLVWLVPVGLWCGVKLFRAWRDSAEADRRSALLAPLRRTALALALPFAATLAWTRFADAVKAGHSSGSFLTSGNMTQFNFGYGDFNVRFSADAWRAMLSIWQHDLMPWPALAGVVVVAAIFGGRWRRHAFVCLGVFLLAQFVFPLLYAWHDYYFVANTTFLLLAAGFALAGLFESRHRLVRALAFPALGALLFVQARAYAIGYYPAQATHYFGGDEVAIAVRAATERDDVLVIAGNDWHARTPFFAQRRALMLRRELESDWPYVDRAFRDLAGESVGALILQDAQRQNWPLLLRAVRAFGIDPRPAFHFPNATVYLARSRVPADIPAFDASALTVEQLPALPSLLPDIGKVLKQEVDVARLPRFQREIFACMQPEPIRFYSTFGAGSVRDGEKTCFNAHPVTRLWFRVPENARHLRVTYGLFAGAYDGTARGTDGIEVVVTLRPADGSKPRELLRRLTQPVTVPADRGDQTIDLPLTAAAGDELQLELLPGPRNDSGWDWTYIRDVRIE